MSSSGLASLWWCRQGLGTSQGVSKDFAVSACPAALASGNQHGLSIQVAHAWLMMGCTWCNLPLVNNFTELQVIRHEKEIQKRQQMTPEAAAAHMQAASLSDQPARSSPEAPDASPVDNAAHDQRLKVLQSSAGTILTSVFKLMQDRSVFLQHLPLFPVSTIVLCSICSSSLKTSEGSHMHQAFLQPKGFL